MLSGSIQSPPTPKSNSLIDYKNMFIEAGEHWLNRSFPVVYEILQTRHIQKNDIAGAIIKDLVKHIYIENNTMEFSALDILLKAQSPI